MAGFEGYRIVDHVHQQLDRLVPTYPSYVIKAGNIEGFPHEKGRSWFSLRRPEVEGIDKPPGLGSYFSEGSRTAIITPEILQVEALRLDSWANRYAEGRRVNGYLFLGSLMVEGADVTIFGVHILGIKDAGQINTTSVEDDSPFDELVRSYPDDHTIWPLRAW